MRVKKSKVTALIDWNAPHILRFIRLLCVCANILKRKKCLFSFSRCCRCCWSSLLFCFNYSSLRGDYERLVIHQPASHSDAWERSAKVIILLRFDIIGKLLVTHLNWNWQLRKNSPVIKKRLERILLSVKIQRNGDDTSKAASSLTNGSTIEASCLCKISWNACLKAQSGEWNDCKITSIYGVRGSRIQ